MGYPTAPDLLSFLGAANLTGSAALQAQFGAALNAARRDLEEKTDRRFLAGDPATRHYDPPTNPKGVLYLQRDLASVQSVTVRGVALVEGTDFWSGPAEAADDGEPFAFLEFARRWYTLAPQDKRSVAVTGPWGWAAVPDDVFQAILARAAWRLHPAIAQAKSGGLISWKNDDVSQTYGDDPLAHLRDGWQQQYDAAVEKYTRRTVG